MIAVPSSANQQNKFSSRLGRHIYGSSRLGMETSTLELIATGNLSPLADAQPYTTNADDRVYELTNHLGNVLATFTGRKLPLTEADLVVGFAPHVTSLSDYYPFGSGMEGRVVDGTYRYGFQGQETDDEYFNGAVSFKYRVHDARLGRFLSIDPLAPDYPWNSTYAFSENRVVDAIELEGLESKIIIKYYNQYGHRVKTEVYNYADIEGTVAENGPYGEGTLTIKRKYNLGSKQYEFEGASYDETWLEWAFGVDEWMQGAPDEVQGREVDFLEEWLIKNVDQGGLKELADVFGNSAADASNQNVVSMPSGSDVDGSETSESDVDATEQRDSVIVSYQIEKNGWYTTGEMTKAQAPSDSAGGTVVVGGQKHRIISTRKKE